MKRDVEKWIKRDPMAKQNEWITGYYDIVEDWLEGQLSAVDVRERDDQWRRDLHWQEKWIHRHKYSEGADSFFRQQLTNARPYVDMMIFVIWAAEWAERTQVEDAPHLLSSEEIDGTQSSHEELGKLLRRRILEKVVGEAVREKSVGRPDGRQL